MNYGLKYLITHCVPRRTHYSIKVAEIIGEGDHQVPL
jgi:hypothetical protein